MVLIIYSLKLWICGTYRLWNLVDEWELSIVEEGVVHSSMFLLMYAIWSISLYLLVYASFFCLIGAYESLSFLWYEGLSVVVSSIEILFKFLCGIILCTMLVLLWLLISMEN